MRNHRIKSKIITYILLVSLLIQSVFVDFNSVSAMNSEKDYTNTNVESQLTDFDVETSNSLAHMIGDEIESDYSEDEQSLYSVYSVEMDGSKANIEIDTKSDATVVVGIYDEITGELLNSESVSVNAQDKSASIMFSEDSMPEYYIIRAYIVDTDNFTPLSNEYESTMYTQEMQEFLSKTTADFEEEKVFELDESTTNNFAVYSSDVIIIPYVENENIVDSADDDKAEYVLSNVNQYITQLEEGDIFSYEYGENQLLIVKVASISIENNTAIITGEDVELEDVFEYMKIDQDTVSDEDSEISNESSDNGVAYEGMTNYDDSIFNNKVSEETSIKKSINFTIDGSLAKVPISGGIGLSFEGKLKLYVTKKHKYFEFKLETEGKLNLEVSKSVDFTELELGKVSIRPIPAVKISFTPKFIAEFEGKISFEATITTTAGFRYSSDVGFENLSESPSLDWEVAAEGTFFVGFEIEPSVAIVHENLIKASVKARLGKEITMKKEIFASASSSEKHDCGECYSGDASRVFSLSIELSFFKVAKIKKTFVEVKQKLGEFYFNADTMKFGFGKCPNKSYKTTIIVKDVYDNLLENVSVSVDEKNYTTNADGVVILYLRKGKHQVYVNKVGIGDGSKTFHIVDNSKKMLFRIGNGTSQILEDGEVPCIFKKVRAGRWHSAALTVDGDLYVWGSDYNAQVGDSICKGGIVKLRDVIDFDIDYDHNAAITSNGDLYTWGEQGQVGYDEDDYTYGRRRSPAKILSNVKKVDLGTMTNVAVQNDGTLYMWGYFNEDYHSQEGSYPVAMMSDIKEAASGFNVWGVIKEDGYLYIGTRTGEYNTSNPLKTINNIKTFDISGGRITVVTNDNVLYDVNFDGSVTKIMDNVDYAVLDGYNNALVTTNGDMYVWGYDNEYGQIGDGTTTPKTVPVKVLENVVSMDVGERHTLAITKGGNLYAWGLNRDGQLGDISNYGEIYYTTPQRVTYYSPFTDDEASEVTLLNNSVSMNGTNATALFDEDGYIIPDDVTRQEYTYSSKFSELEPNKIYNLYVMQSRDAYNPLSGDNLIHIRQIVADESGNATFDFYSSKELFTYNSDLGEEILSAEVFLVGQEKLQISEAVVETNDLEYTGNSINPIKNVQFGDLTLVEGTDYELEGDYQVTDAGKYTVYINGIGKYSGSIKVDYEIKVSAQEICIETEDTSLNVGESLKLEYSIMPENVTHNNVIWSVSDNNIGMVDGEGEFTAMSPGKVTITVSTADGTNITDTYDIEVYQAYETPSSPKLNAKTENSVTLEPMEGCEYSKDKINWQKSNIFNDLKEDTEYIFYARKVGTGYYITSDVSEGVIIKTNSKAQPEQPKSYPTINTSYRTHIQSYGWEGNADDIKTWNSNGTMSGTSGKAKRLEGINIVVNSAEAGKDVDLGIQYTTHCQSYGWLPWSADGDMNGTEGEAKRLEAIKIQLTGADKDAYDVYYRVHAQSYGWLNWAKNGAPSGTAGYGKRLEGIQIVVVKKGESFNRKMEGITSVRTESYIAKEGSSPIVNYTPTSNTNPVIPGADTPNVAYRTHVQSFGWQGWKYNGQMSGTSGLAKRLEGININLTNKPCDGDIVYTTHVQTYGWKDGKPEDTTRASWKKNGAMSGTSGEAKRLEAICIDLTGEMGEKYDIYYRVHAQSFGWLGWAKNGEESGTAGYAKRLEGIQIVLVPKGGAAPANDFGGVTSVRTEGYISK